MATYVSGILVGHGQYARNYLRYDGSLVVRFAPGLLPDFAAETALGLNRRFGETPQWLWGLEADSARWYDGLPDADLRDIAHALEGQSQIEWASPVFHPSDSLDDAEAAVPVPGDLLVDIEEGYEGSVITELGARYLDWQSTAADAIGTGWHLFRLDPNLFRDEIFDQVDAIQSAAIPGIRAFELDWLKLTTYHAAFPQGPPDDPLWSKQWGPNKIRMESAWAKTDGKPGVPVAVIDSGFDLNHADVVYEPYADGRHLDVELLWQGVPNTGPAGPSPFAHGTPVAGVIGAPVNSGTGIAGIAGACKIVPIRLGEIPSSGRVAAALSWARAKKVRVVNLSLTTVETSVVIDEIEKCAAANPSMVLCAATGNALPGPLASTTVGFPARHPDVIGVGASDEDDFRKTEMSKDKEKWQSRYGDGLNVVAPGVGLWSTDESGKAGWNNRETTKVTWYGVDAEISPGETSGDYIALFGGTSGATPHVSGLASLILEGNKALSAAKVREIIERACSKNGAYLFGEHPAYAVTDSGLTWNLEVGCGRIDALEALETAPTLALTATPKPAPPFDPADISGCVPFDGHLGRAAVPGIWRVYATTTFDRWVEIREEDIRRVSPLGGGQKGSRVWVVRGAEIRGVATRALIADRGPVTARAPQR